MFNVLKTEKGQSPGTESRLRWRKDQTQWRQATEQQDRYGLSAHNSTCMCGRKLNS